MEERKEEEERGGNRQRRPETLKALVAPRDGEKWRLVKVLAWPGEGQFLIRRFADVG